MQVGILGPLEVRADDGAVIDVAGARLRSLLTRLAVDAGRPVPLAALVDAVWGDEPPAEEANALQTLVSRLRRSLGDATMIGQSPAGYRLGIEAEDVDAVRFERLAADGAAALRAGEVRRAATVLLEALTLWRGPALLDAGEFAAPYAARLDELRLATVVERLDAELRLGNPAGVAAELEGLAGEHPLHERIAGQLITALASSGRQADALAAYERVRATLADELGVDPSAELQTVHVAVLRGEIGVAPPARRTNLRAQLTSFIGRADEVARIAKSLELSRLVTLVGPGGAGKTRLASEAAATIVDGAADGVWLVELAPVTDAADLPQTVLGSLGGRAAHLLDRRTQLTARDATTRLLESLGDKSAVLIFDNCEHLIEASARLADQLLAECPRLRVLATSREPLGIFGEALLVVPPLGQPAADAPPAEALDYPAVRLFADRAAAVRPDFVVDDTTVPTVIEIVRRLDGLPLAIELAAARLRSLPLKDIAARLSDRFRLLTGGSRTAMPRHRTLRAVVEWSWELLSPPERLLAERLAVFPAGATEASASAVCADDVVGAREVGDLLTSLVDKSLLQPVSGGSRLRMLETIREYGIERLAERGELPELRARHADYFAGLLREAEPHLVSAGQVPWFDLLTAERDNIMAALRFRRDIGDADGALEIGVASGGFAMLLGSHADVPVWLGEALAVPGATNGELRWVGEALYAMNATMTDPVRETVDANLLRMADLGNELDGIDMSSHPLFALLRPAIAFLAGDIERAQRLMEDALHGGDEWVAASVLMFRGNVAENEGDVAGMRDDLVAALAEFRRIGERWGTASALRAMAQLHTLDGDLDAAMAAYVEALELMAELNSRDDEGFLRIRMADLCVRRGDLVGAREQVRLARLSTDATGSTIELVFTLAMSAEVERQLGNVDTARELHAQATARLINLPLGHPVQGHSRAIVLALSVRLSVEEGDLVAARHTATAAYEAAVGTHDLPIIAAIGVMTADLASRSARPETAAEMLGAAARLRGAEDRTADDIRRLLHELAEELGTARFEQLYERGRSLDRDAAILLLKPE